MAVTKRLYGSLHRTIRRMAARVNQLSDATMPLGNPTLAIDTNFDIKNTVAIDYMIAGSLYTLAINTNVNTGTAATIETADYWGIVLVSANTSAACTATWLTNSTAGYSTEALAIAALAASDIPASECVIGYVTVKTKASTALWTAGTDALQGGSGGDVSADTNYYNDANPNGIVAPSFTFADGAPSEAQ